MVVTDELGLALFWLGMVFSLLCPNPIELELYIIKPSIPNSH